MDRAVSKKLSEFVDRKINECKKTKRHFDKISESYDEALIKNSQTPKSKPAECEDVRNLLTATRGCFQHTALDYIRQISCLQSQKRYEVLDSVSNYLNGENVLGIYVTSSPRTYLHLFPSFFFRKLSL